MRLFLTGATGFIGSHLARRLVREGCEVTALVRPGADRRRLADVQNRLTIVEGDLRAPRELARALQATAPEVCVHLAWCATGDYLHADENLAFVSASVGLLPVLNEAGCRRIVLAGTCVEYDTTPGLLTEASPIRPRTLYAACKQALWLMTEQFAHARTWSAVSAKLFQVYGPDEHEARLVPRVIRSLRAGEPCSLTSGDQRRDFLHVEDVAAALAALARSEITGPVNVGGSAHVPVAEVARELGHLLGRPDLIRLGALPPRADEPPCLCASPGRWQAELGWTPRYNLPEGLRHTVDWWRVHVPDGHVLPALSE